jgi:hypothetical protein
MPYSEQCWQFGLYVIGSLYCEQSKEEQSLTEEFMNILATGIIPTPIVSGESFINLSDKKAAILKLLHQYFPYAKSQEILEQCLYLRSKKNRYQSLNSLNF